MVYESGTSSGQVNFVTSNGDGIGFGGGQTSSQSLLAQKVKPPLNPDWSIAHFILLFFIPVGTVIFSAALVPDWIILILILAGILGFLTWFALNQQVEKKKPVYQIQFARWMQSWICLKCGAVWELKK